MAGILPAAGVPGMVPESARYDTKYKRSAAWDAVSGDFVRDGAGRVAECSGREAFAIWCFKTAQTERYRCAAYPDSIGTEMERAMASDDAKTVESMVQRTITDALMVNPRTEYVRDFSFSWDGDQMHCTFCVKGTGQEFFFVTL